MQDIKAIFKEFHAHPELSFKEYQTTERIRRILKEENVQVLDLPLETGLVACIQGAQSGKTLAFRCDIDALPITEQSGLPYASQQNGVMHACGHDIHICTGIKLACLLNARKASLAGTFYVVFQPGEEQTYGALKIMDTGILDNVDYIFAVHCNPELKVGEVGIKKGSVTAACARFKIEVKGKGAHGAKPEEGIDPIVAASHLVQGLQTVVSRSISALKPAVVSVTHIEGGSSWNIIPESVILEGTVRTSDADSTALAQKKITDFVAGTDCAFGTTSTIDYPKPAPAVINDADLVKVALSVAEKKKLEAVETEQSMVGEDFAWYLEKLKGILIWAGSGHSENLHNPAFKADPAMLDIIPEYIEELLETVSQNQKK